MKITFDLNFINLGEFAVESEELATLIDFKLAELEARIMSVFSEKIDALESAWNEAMARIQVDVDELKRLVAAGAPAPELLARLDALTTKLNTYDPLPDFPPTPPPPPVP